MNIILFSLDTVRADHLSCYGYKRLTSPHIDRVASEGALFLECFNPHIPTYPGHTTMMTGRDVYAHQITGQSSELELSSEIPMLAEILKEHGWWTAAADTLGKWFQRGFDVYGGYVWDKKEQRSWRAGEAVTELALNLLNKAASQSSPFFLFVHYWDAHTPYVPPAPFDRMFYGGDERRSDCQTMAPVWACEQFKWYFHEWMPGVTDIEFPKAQYDAEIAYMDACLAHIFNRLDELGLSEDTLIVMTADHGEELDEHGCWFDHHGLYDTNLHIPLILRWPGQIPAGLRIRGMTAMMDIMPTILDYAGVSTERLVFDGSSLRPVMDGIAFEEDQPPFRTVIHLTENTWMKKRGVRTGEWKLIRALEADFHGFPEVELYHIISDPIEKINVAEKEPGIVSELTRLMEDHVARRTQETGHSDPLPRHPIPLRSIGQRPAQDEPVDDNRPEADFVGYAREGDAA